MPGRRCTRQPLGWLWSNSRMQSNEYVIRFAVLLVGD